MKKHLFIFVLLMFPVVLIAQVVEPVVTAGNGLWDTIIPILITVLIPVAIQATRTHLVPDIPKWLLPILATGGGALLGVLIDLIPGADVTVVGSAIYGGLSVWLRDFIHEARKASGILPPKTPALPTAKSAT